MNSSLPHQGAIIGKELFITNCYDDNNGLIASDWIFIINHMFNRTLKYIGYDDIICDYDFTGVSSSSEAYLKIIQEKTDYLKNVWPEFLEYYNEIEEMKTKIKKVRSNFYVRVIRKLSLLGEI